MTLLPPHPSKREREKKTPPTHVPHTLRGELRVLVQNTSGLGGRLRVAAGTTALIARGFPTVRRAQQAEGFPAVCRNQQAALAARGIAASGRPGRADCSGGEAAAGAAAAAAAAAAEGKAAEEAGGARLVSFNGQRIEAAPPHRHCHLWRS